MSYSLLLATPSTFVHLSRSLSLSFFPPPPLSHRSPPARLLPPRFSYPSGSLPSWRCSIEIQFPPAHPSHLPTFSLPLPLFLYYLLRLLLLLYISYNSSRPPSPFGRPSAPGKGSHCIPRDKLRGSIIHGNLQAPLFKRRPSSISPGRRRRYRRHRDISPGGT